MNIPALSIPITPFLGYSLLKLVQPVNANQGIHGQIQERKRLAVEGY